MDRPVLANMVCSADVSGGHTSYHRDLVCDFRGGVGGVCVASLWVGAPGASSKEEGGHRSLSSHDRGLLRRDGKLDFHFLHLLD